MDPLPDVEALAARVESSADEPTKEAAREMVRGVLALHARGLLRVLEILRRAGDPGDAILERLVEDPTVASLLVLHDLHPQDLGARAQAAVERLKGAYPDLALLGVAQGHVRVRVGARGGGDASARVVHASLLESIPDARSVEVEVTSAPDLVTLRRKEPTG